MWGGGRKGRTHYPQPRAETSFRMGGGAQPLSPLAYALAPKIPLSQNKDINGFFCLSLADALLDWKGF